MPKAILERIDRYVVLGGGVVVGMASAVHYVHPDKPAQLFINEVGVAPSHQRRGIACDLIVRLLAPGHSPGSPVYIHHASKQAWSGDVLFAGGVGRFDLPGSDGPTLLRSIREQLLDLPDDYRLYPDHGPATTIGRERRSNPYLQAGAEYLFES